MLDSMRRRPPKLSFVVESRACVSNDWTILLSPSCERHDGDEQGTPGPCQSVIHPRRSRRCHGPSDQRVALEAAQRQREHPLRDSIDRTPKLVEPQRTIAKDGNDENAPFVADPFEHVANGAIVVLDLRPDGHLGYLSRAHRQRFSAYPR